MHLEVLGGEFSICQVRNFTGINPDDEFLFLAKTDSEFSAVCRTESVPDNTINREDGWTAFRVAGNLEFSLVGILADISRCLAEAGVSIFAVSTYNTDYILVKKENWEKAEEVLTAEGHTVSAAPLAL
ncbi:MAG: ACT domain-containing protein [Methanocorpusculum sp.]|nr:ACT domain-containing protein [Methanocorpusculum sp.]MBR5142485.1 ACT domain-containing protein [Methanocorpusculum sp.]